MTLRLETADGRVVEEYRISGREIQVREFPSTPADSAQWRTLSASELTAHAMKSLWSHSGCSSVWDGGLASGVCCGSACTVPARQKKTSGARHNATTLLLSLGPWTQAN
jgi:hypothetical protein